MSSCESKSKYLVKSWIRCFKNRENDVILNLILFKIISILFKQILKIGLRVFSRYFFFGGLTLIQLNVLELNVCCWGSQWSALLSGWCCFSSGLIYGICLFLIIFQLPLSAQSAIQFIWWGSHKRGSALDSHQILGEILFLSLISISRKPQIL